MNRTVPKPILRGALALSVLALALAATEARASTAANTRITNTATVTYNDQGNNPQTPVTAQATVTVTLVGSAPLLDSPPNQTIAQGTSATLHYTITSTANGPDTYTLSDVATQLNLAGATVTLPANPVLGGTTLAADAVTNATTITVPWDFAAGATVNGIGVTSVIVINGNQYTVTAVDKTNAATTNAVTLTLGSGILGATVPAGSIVGERRTFDVTVTSGAVSGNNTSGTVTVTTTATSTSGSHATSQLTPTVITVNRPLLTVTKEVSIDGTSFAATVNAAPTTTLYYRITVTNNGATPASAVTFADAIPAYLTYVAASARFATAAGAAYGAGTALTDGADADGYSFSAPNISYAPGGTLAGGGVLVLFYRATIN